MSTRKFTDRGEFYRFKVIYFDEREKEHDTC